MDDLKKQGAKLCKGCNRVLLASDPDYCEDCQEQQPKARPMPKLKDEPKPEPQPTPDSNTISAR